jgi:hypothetical protein
VYNKDVSKSFYAYLSNSSENIGYVFMDNCGGGIICPPNDAECSENLNAIFSYLEEHFNLVYDKTRGRCRYRIYQN